MITHKTSVVFSILYYVSILTNDPIMGCIVHWPTIHDNKISSSQISFTSTPAACLWNKRVVVDTHYALTVHTTSIHAKPLSGICIKDTTDKFVV